MTMDNPKQMDPVEAMLYRYPKECRHVIEAYGVRDIDWDKWPYEEHPSAELLLAACLIWLQGKSIEDNLTVGIRYGIVTVRFHEDMMWWILERVREHLKKEGVTTDD